MAYRKQMSSEILDFLREVDENWGLLVHYAAWSSNTLPTFRDNLSVTSSRVKIQDHYKLRSSPEEYSSQMSSVSVSWFINLGCTESHTRTLLFLLCEGKYLLGTSGENSGRTRHSTLHVAYTIFVCSQCRGSSVGLTTSCYRQAGLWIRDVLPVLSPIFLSNRCKLVAWLPTAVPQDASRADFMCKRWRRVFGLIIFFAAVLYVCLYRNSRHMVEWGIVTFAASISEESVAFSRRKFYFVRNFC